MLPNRLQTVMFSAWLHLYYKSNTQVMKIKCCNQLSRYTHATQAHCLYRDNSAKREVARQFMQVLSNWVSPLRNASQLIMSEYTELN